MRICLVRPALLILLLALFPACENDDHSEPLGGRKIITITTHDIGMITQNTATAGGEIGDTYGTTIQDYGHCWDTAPQPDRTDPHTSFGSITNGTGFFSILTDLTPATKYYVRAYMLLQDSTSVYGAEKSFTTLGPASVEDLMPGISKVH